MEQKGTEKKTDCETSLGKLHKVILFNDDIHWGNAVMSQIQKAIHCDHGRAHAIVMATERYGNATVIISWIERCEHVASVLGEIGLNIEIEPA